MHTILNIEDDMINIRLMRRYMKAGNYRLVEATTGEAGIAIATGMLPDAILVDIHLPDMNGRDVVAQLRQLSHLIDTPIIALTADDREILRKQCLTEGFTTYLTKPVSVGTLHMTLENVLHIPHNESLQPT